jgi:hypothetical protein
MTRPRILAGFAGAIASMLLAAPVLAHECINVSKSDPTAGAQLVLGANGEVLSISRGLANRIEQGLVDFDTGAGFHGQIAFDIDGDGTADLSTWFGVGPDGEIPLAAQFHGPACRGLTNIGIYMEQCLGG